MSTREWTGGVCHDCKSSIGSKENAGVLRLGPLLFPVCAGCAKKRNLKAKKPINKTSIDYSNLPPDQELAEKEGAPSPR